VRRRERPQAQRPAAPAVLADRATAAALWRSIRRAPPTPPEGADANLRELFERMAASRLRRSVARYLAGAVGEFDEAGFVADARERLRAKGVIS
jgi:hypothetical protein